MDKDKRISGLIEALAVIKDIARLIASAPELLDALQHIREELRDVAEANELFLTARDAILRATDDTR